MGLGHIVNPILERWNLQGRPFGARGPSCINMVMLPDLVRDFRARRKFDVYNYIVNKGGAGAYRESNFRLIDWLFIVLRPTENISLIWRRHQCRWRAAKFRPMFGTLGLLAERDLYRATPAVTRGLGFSGLIRMTAPFSRLLYDTQGDAGDLFNPDPHGCRLQKKVWNFGESSWHSIGFFGSLQF